MADPHPNHSSEDAADSGARPSPPRRLGTSIVVGALGIFSVIYLLNPTGGFIEFIPDNIPLFGNLDEVAISALLISCLAYFGIDIRRIFGFRVDHPQRDEVVDVEGEEQR